MRPTAIVAAVMGVGLLAGCQPRVEPAQPPTPEPALTTSSAPVVTEEPAPTTEEPEPTTEEAGPPEMPEEAKEQTQAGAEAFVEHWIDLINYTGKNPKTGLLDPLAGAQCKSCQNHIEAVSYGVEHGDHLKGDTFTLGKLDSLLTADGAARVEADVTQDAQTYYRDTEPIDRELDKQEGHLVFRLNWDDGWTISEITVA